MRRSVWCKTAAGLLVACVLGCPAREPVLLGPTRLTEEPIDVIEPAFSPDGKFIACTFKLADREHHITVVEIETGSKRRLTSGATLKSSPAWSPDGKRIAFKSTRDGKSNLYVVSAETGEGDGSSPAQALTRHASLNGAPAWSPDGQFLAFESDREGRFDIWVMNADGGNPHPLTKPASHDTGPAWSPDGKLIAFSSERSGSRDIWIIGPDGSWPRRITATNDAREWAPTWTPDSAQIAYACADRIDQTELWKVFADGSKPSRVLAASATLRDPAVSPDGKWLAFSSSHKGTYDLYLLKLKD